MTRDYIKSDCGYTDADAREWAIEYGRTRARNNQIDGTLDTAGLPREGAMCLAFDVHFKQFDRHTPLDYEGNERLYELVLATVHDAYLLEMDVIYDEEIDAWETRHGHEEFR